MTCCPYCSGYGKDLCFLLNMLRLTIKISNSRSKSRSTVFKVTWYIYICKEWTAVRKMRGSHELIGLGRRVFKPTGFWTWLIHFILQLQCYFALMVQMRALERLCCKTHSEDRPLHTAAQATHTLNPPELPLSYFCNALEILQSPADLDKLPPKLSSSPTAAPHPWEAPGIISCSSLHCGDHTIP